MFFCEKPWQSKPLDVLFLFCGDSGNLGLGIIHYCDIDEYMCCLSHHCPKEEWEYTMSVHHFLEV